jgi:hypothetical protein
MWIPINSLIRYNNRCGSISFPGCTDSYIQIPYKANMRPNDKDFTIEWFQYMEHAPSNTKQTVFSIGRAPNCAIGVTFFFRDDSWNLGLHLNGTSYYICPVEIINTWVHFAVTRKGNDIHIFKSGELLDNGYFSDECNLDYSNPALILGNFSPPSIKCAFKGCISNFRWIVGTCLYDDDFIVPTSPLRRICNTKLLLLMICERDALKDNSYNVRHIQHVEGSHISPPEDSAEDANRIMWIETTPFLSA